MDRERILGRLREHEPEVKAAGVTHLRLFGSVARGDATFLSDVDLLFECNDSQAGDLLAAYSLQDRVAQILGMSVHLSSAKQIKPRIRERVLREAVLPFSDPKAHLGDNLASIDAIEPFLAGADLSSYRADVKTRSAVERKLQILTEAAFQLRDGAAELCPTVDWRGIRGLGNALRHEYDDIDDEMIWNAIQSRLPPLRIAVHAALENPQRQGDQAPL